MTMAMYFIGFNEDGTARFYFTAFPIISKDGLFRVKKLQMDTNLKTKRLASAVLDNESDLSPRETLILLFFFWVSAHHVKMHSLANWAVQVETSRGNISFQSQNGIATGKMHLRTISNTHTLCLEN